MRTVAITGVGVVSPIGLDHKAFTAGLDRGTVGIASAPWANPEVGDYSWIAPIVGFDAGQWFDARLIDGTDLFTQYAVGAAVEAIEDFGGELDPMRTGVVMGVNQGGARALLNAQHLYDTGGRSAVPKKLTLQFPHNMPAAQIAMRWKLHGPSLTVSTACASSLDAIGIAARMIESGQTDVVITGGAERGLCDTLYYSQAAYGMSRPVDDPLRACLPFDVDRNGIVEGAGAGIIVLEAAEHARARGAHVYGQVAGYGSVSDSYHPSSPDPSGQWEAAAMRQALTEAGLGPGDVGALIAHATGTPLGDMAEVLAINDVFAGQSDLPVTSVKGHVGHPGAAAGVFGVVAGLHAFDAGTISHVAGTHNPEPHANFRVVMDQPADVALEAFQVNAFGFGGQNASLVVRR